MRNLLFYGFAASLLFLAVACQKDANAADLTANADCTVVPAVNTYSSNIKAIIDGSCAYSDCHSANSNEGNVTMSTYATAKSAFENRDALCTIHQASGCRPMPQGGAKLSDAVINQIDCWVKNGYLE